MFDRVILRIRRLILDRRFWMTSHADDEMDADDLTILDVEHCVLTGEITERQRDQKTGEWKYVIRGETLGEYPAVVVGKISPTEMFVIVTVYAL